MNEVRDILEKLVVDEKDLKQELAKQVDDAAKIFRIERPSGKIAFKDFGSLSDKQRIAVVLMGKYFATKLGIVPDATLSISEVANELGRPVTALSGPVKDLVRQGFVEYLTERRYKIVYHRIGEIFEKVLSGKKEKRSA